MHDLGSLEPNRRNVLNRTKTKKKKKLLPQGLNQTEINLHFLFDLIPILYQKSNWNHIGTILELYRIETKLKNIFYTLAYRCVYTL